MSSLISDHLVTHLVDDICLHQRFLLDQKVLGFRQFIKVGGVQRISEIFQCRAKRITDRILHQNVVLVFRIPEDRPAVDRLIHHSLVVKDTDSSPAVWYGIFILRVKLSGLFHILFADILDIRNVVKVDL